MGRCKMYVTCCLAKRCRRKYKIFQRNYAQNQHGMDAMESRIDKLKQEVSVFKHSLFSDMHTIDATRVLEDEMASLTNELRYRHAVARQKTLRPDSQGRLKNKNCYNCGKRFYEKENIRTICKFCGFAHCQNCARFRENLFTLGY